MVEWDCVSFKFSSSQDMSYCEWKVKTSKSYAHGRRLLDLIDLHIMDYLIGNQGFLFIYLFIVES
jgi:hypothetical protein